MAGFKFSEDAENVWRMIEWWRNSKFRPTGALPFYERHLERLRNRSNPRVLVLGVTPELRMLALRKGCEVTAVDISMVMLNAMSEFMDYSGLDKTRETVIHGDWLSVPLEKQGYDLAMGDGFLNCLDNLRDYGTLLARLRDLLKPDGYVSTRTSNLPDTWKPMNILELLEDYGNSQTGNPHPGCFDLQLSLRLALSADSYSEQSGRWSWKKVIGKLRMLEEEGRISNEIFKPMLDYFYDMPQFWTIRDRTMPRRHVLEDCLRRDFDVVERVNVGGAATNMYLLKPLVKKF